ncbi:hypothetical protein BJ165DRAFT_667108 [Panaeolus papilionaceus]|nr:hypothetical protein BJ165DRAFT_667108 [Panaeolus papilionaceus]
MNIMMDSDEDIVDWRNLNSLSDPASEESDSDSDSGSGLESGSDESKKSTSEKGGEVELRARDEIMGDFEYVFWSLLLFSLFIFSSISLPYYVLFSSLPLNLTHPHMKQNKPTNLPSPQTPRQKHPPTRHCQLFLFLRGTRLEFEFVDGGINERVGLDY